MTNLLTATALLLCIVAPAAAQTAPVRIDQFDNPIDVVEPTAPPPAFDDTITNSIQYGAIAAGSPASQKPSQQTSGPSQENENARGGRSN